MGRIFYANTHEPVSDRSIHVIKTPPGTIVLAMRPPKVGERGYSVGLDCTVVDAVLEMFNDWDPSEEGPGWVYMQTHRSRRGNNNQEPRTDNEVQTGAEQLFDVTILAAFENDRVTDESDAKVRAVQILRRWPDGKAKHGDDFDVEQDRENLAIAIVDSTLEGTMPEDLRPVCEECHELNDDEGECGPCGNCKMPLCIHDMPDDRFALIAHRFDTPCDRWKIKDGKLDAEATHAMHTAATKGEV